mgnify:FL=1
MPKVNIQMKAQPADADMVQTSLSFENIYYSLWEIAGRYSSFCQFRVIGNSHDERMIPMLEVGTGAQMIFCVAGINGTQTLLPELLLKMAGEYCRAYECGWKLDEFYEVKKLLDKIRICLIPILTLMVMKSARMALVPFEIQFTVKCFVCKAFLLKILDIMPEEWILHIIFQLFIISLTYGRGTSQRE